MKKSFLALRKGRSLIWLSLANNMKNRQDVITCSKRKHWYCVKNNSYFIMKYPKVYKMCQGLPIFFSCHASFHTSVECAGCGLYQSWHLNRVLWICSAFSFPLYNSDSEAGVDPLSKHWHVRVYFVEDNLLSTWNFCRKVQHLF